MEHHDVISVLIIIVVVVVLYKLSQVQLTTTDMSLGYLVILLQIMSLAFDHLYDAFGDKCM